MVDGCLGVVDVFVDHVGRAARVLVRPDSYLPYRSVLAEDVIHLLAGDVERQVPHIEHAVYLGRKPGVSFPETDRRHCGLGFGRLDAEKIVTERTKAFPGYLMGKQGQELSGTELYVHIWQVLLDTLKR